MYLASVYELPSKYGPNTAPSDKTNKESPAGDVILDLNIYESSKLLSELLILRYVLISVADAKSDFFIANSS